MKRERIQFLVTCSLAYDTLAERREAIATARQDLLSVRTGGIPSSRPVRATLVKRDLTVSEWVNLMPVPRAGRA